MQKYQVMYRVKAYGYVTVEAEDVDDALERASWEPFDRDLEIIGATPVNILAENGEAIVLDETNKSKSEKGTLDENKRAD